MSKRVSKEWRAWLEQANSQDDGSIVSIDNKGKIRVERYTPGPTRFQRFISKFKRK
jgi:hypothetical protein